MLRSVTSKKKNRYSIERIIIPNKSLISSPIIREEVGYPKKLILQDNAGTTADNAGTTADKTGTMHQHGDNGGRVENGAAERGREGLATLAYPHGLTPPHGAIPARHGALEEGQTIPAAHHPAILPDNSP